MINKKISIFILPLLLSACTDNGLLFRSSGGYENKDPNIIYMVGESYQIQNETYVPKEDYTYIEEGEASWYDWDGTHKITTNGEISDENSLSAMHRTLPLPSIVKITNLENNETALVRVNERGPMVQNRIIDVSKATAEKLKFNKEGTTKVLVEIMPDESKNLKKELLKKEADDALKSVPMNNFYTAGDIPLVTYQEEKQTPKKTQEKSVQKDSDIIYSYKKHIQTIKQPAIQIGAFKNISTAQKIQADLASYSPVIIQKEINGKVLNCVQITSFETKKEALNTLDKIHHSGYPEAQVILQ